MAITLTDSLAVCSLETPASDKTSTDEIESLITPHFIDFNKPDKEDKNQEDTKD